MFCLQHCKETKDRHNLEGKNFLDLDDHKTYPQKSPQQSFDPFNVIDWNGASL